MSHSQGKLIVIDGIDGSGKATQTKIIVDKIRQLGFGVETMAFPQYDKNFFGGMVRKYLDGKFGVPTEVNPQLASVLYAADRWESSSIIKQWLDDGKIVILDRYSTSNLIHQSAKLPETEINNYVAWLKKMEYEIFKIPEPDKVIFLHVNAETSLELIKKRGEGQDGHDTIQHLKIAEARCLYLAKKLDWLIVECCQNKQLLTIDQVAELVWKKIKPTFNA